MRLILHLMSLWAQPPLPIPPQATGEPSVLFGVGVMFAIRSALQASRKDRDLDLKQWVQLGEEKVQGQGGANRQKMCFKIDYLISKLPFNLSLQKTVSRTSQISNRDAVGHNIS